jgi:hypothetical protein
MVWTYDLATPRAWTTASGSHIISFVRWPLLALVAVAACSHKDTSLSKAQSDSLANSLIKLGDTTALHSHVSGHRYGSPTGKIRVANLLELNGQPSVPVDLYDTRNPDSTATPLIKNLAFGQVSDYVSPRAADNYPGSPSNLYIFPTGTKQASHPYGDRIDNSGFAATDQVSVALGPSNFAGTPGISLTAIDEAGKRLNATLDSTRVVPAGNALLILLQGNMSADSLPEQYLMVDGTCPLATPLTAHTIPTPTGNNLNFAVAPGTHTLGVVTSPRGRGLLNCTGKQPGQTSTVSVSAGQRYVVFIYGVPSDGFKALAAQIAAP